MNDIIVKAAAFAFQKHAHQVRANSTTPYIVHPMEVATLLATLCPRNKNLIAAGWLHDVIEDCGVTYAELKKEFNKGIADLVYEVTKEKPDPNKAAFFPRLISQDGIILKFADRLSNLSDMRAWSTQKKVWYLHTSRFWRESLNDDIHQKEVKPRE